MWDMSGCYRDLERVSIDVFIRYFWAMWMSKGVRLSLNHKHIISYALCL